MNNIKMTTPEANSIEGLQLQLELVKQMLCDEINFSI